MKSIIRIGDHVRLIDPRPIFRIGYDVTINSLIPGVEKDYEPAGIDNRKTHICLELNLGRYLLTDKPSEWDGFWVTSKQVDILTGEVV